MVSAPINLLKEPYMKTRQISLSMLTSAMLLALAAPAQALVIDAAFSANYTATSLGSVAGLPPLYGGLTVKAGDPNTLLIGGNANTASGLIYEVGVTRGAGNHITGFTGSPVAIGSVGAYNDGGVTYGPGGVLFTSRWPVNGLGQTKPGSVAEDKIIDLAALGVANSHAAINFVPTGFGGAGSMKLVSWSGGQWYDASYSPDGLGTYDILGVTQIDLDLATVGIQNLFGGPEGFVYIAAGNAGFAMDSLLVSEYSAGNVAAYDVDANGNPILTSRRNFITGLTGAEGAAIDPLTGDFLFSTFGGGNQIVVVQGFQVPGGGNGNGNGSVPEPASLALLGIGLAGLGAMRRRKMA